MSDTPGKPGPKPQGYEPFLAQLWPDQAAALRAEGETRGVRQRNAVLRDIIDFWADHRPLFFAWLASRGETPRRPIS
jgi:hypothetical protein